MNKFVVLSLALLMAGVVVGPSLASAATVTDWNGGYRMWGYPSYGYGYNFPFYRNGFYGDRDAAITHPINSFRGYDLNHGFINRGFDNRGISSFNRGIEGRGMMGHGSEGSEMSR